MKTQITASNVLAGSARINQMKKEIDRLISILGGLAVQAVIDLSNREAWDKEFRFALWINDVEIVYLRWQCMLTQPRQPDFTLVAKGIRMSDEHERGKFVASSLTDVETLSTHAALDSLLKSFIETFPSTRDKLKFLASQAS